MEKVQELEREIEELKLKVAGLEEGLKNAEMRISSISTSQVSQPQTDIVQATETVQANQQPVQAMPTPAPTYNNVQPIPAATYSYSNSTQGQSAPIVNNVPPQRTYNTYGNTATPNTYGNYAPQYVQQQRPANNISTESWIGKILMGALASLLVFIALITFAKLLLPYLTDGIKIALMFAASIALTATGFVLSKKKPSNTFFKALLACGSACIYLSILVTGIHFKAINSIVMYVLLAIWAIFMIFLKENKNDWLFFSIGNLGYFVSIMFTSGLKDKNLVIPMLIYVIIISAVYQIMYWKNRRQAKVQSVINIASLLLFQIIVTIIFGRCAEVYIVSALTVIWAFAGYLFFTFADLFKYNRNHFYFAIVNGLAFLFSYSTLNSKLDLPEFITIGILLILAAGFEAICAFWRSNRLAQSESVINAILSGGMCFLAATLLADNYKMAFESGFIMIGFSLIAVYGILKKDVFFKLQGWALIALCMFIGFTTDTGVFFGFVCMVIAVASLIVEGIVLNDSALFKALSYICLLISIMRMGYLLQDIMVLSGKEDMVCLGTYAVMAILNMVLTLTGFYKTNDKNNGRELHLVLDVLNLLFILAGAGLMGIVHGKSMKAIYMVITFALACVNMPVKGNGSRYRYLYTGIKLGVLLLYSLCTFEAPSPVVSMSMIAFAVLCIAIGFKNSLFTKELRIFGLMTTLLFVVKFIVFDISFDSSLMKALSYLISGILCFGISAIYNHFEKKAVSSNFQQ